MILGFPRLWKALFLNGKGLLNKLSQKYKNEKSVSLHGFLAYFNV